MKQISTSFRPLLRTSLLLCTLCLPAWAQSTPAAPSPASAPATPPPPPPPGEWPGLEKLPTGQVRALRVGGGPAFAPSQHQQALKNLKGLPRMCTEEMMRAQWYQDVVHQLESKAHFDNCNFEESVAYIDQLLADARAEAQKGETMAALYKLGQAAHGLQDFYSHTNYIEMMSGVHERFEDVPIVPLWTDEGKRMLQGLIFEKLHSGRVIWNGPQKCDPKDSVPTHSELAKDTAQSPSGKIVIKKWGSRSQYRAASELSDQATTAFIQFALSQMPTIKATCGGVIGYAVNLDRRKE